MMTDNEIVKALECCANNPNDSVCYESKCPLFGQKCIDVLSKNALDLINRQKAEIERLQKHNTKMAHKHYCDGIKEFAERLKAHSRYPNGTIYAEHIDNLVKEMVGDTQ
ncbi:MAG: hypothetical protein E7549_00470 [Ruminococcaceae bacterium]|nr:hypothetical protein [Oscillospiraceae bacterium]